jgi:hypothetical protein
MGVDARPGRPSAASTADTAFPPRPAPLTVGEQAVRALLDAGGWAVIGSTGTTVLVARHSGSRHDELTIDMATGNATAQRFVGPFNRWQAGLLPMLRCHHGDARTVVTTVLNGWPAYAPHEQPAPLQRPIRNSTDDAIERRDEPHD